ncbi:MAG: M6 family metalloprotease domain-containing protein [Prevotella sp.]|nr:M6 family metalloprotease domain-containing protein [Prevotella sp.]
MKKHLILLLIGCLLCVGNVFAVPAFPGVSKVTQPDGTTVGIRLHGDEYMHFFTTEDGYSVVKDAKGFFVYAQLADGVLTPTAMRAHDASQRGAQEQAYLAGVKKHLMPRLTAERAKEKAAEQQRRAKASERARVSRGFYDYASFRGLIILAEFNDCSFASEDYPNIVNEMINRPGYQGYDVMDEFGRYTGSVRDYFHDNSMGLFNPQFDVVGPVKLNCSQYFSNGGKNDDRLMKDVISAADPLVNFSNYDRDDDGIVDMVYIIFAGLGSNFSINDKRLIWPHASSFNWTRADDVYLGRYACSTERYGTEEFNINDGIGTICHEFSHVLGLPDLYDTDYEDGGGQSCHPAEWSLMAAGGYQNYGRTPVGYTLYERYAVGFAVPQTIQAEGHYTLPSVASSNTGYRLNTPVNKEFFLLENRQRTDKWDAYLPGSGMLVYRVDSTNARAWSSNVLNNDPSHNRFVVLRAMGDPDSPMATNTDPFPGAGRVTELNNITSPANLKTWEGHDNPFGLKNIAESDGMISFDVYDANTLTALSLAEQMQTVVGLQLKLELVATPVSAKYTIDWTSSNESVATVSADGVVKALAPGQTTITATSDNDLSATCVITVQDIPLVANTMALKQSGIESEIALALSDAQVVYVHNDDVYLRDETGAVIVENAGGQLTVGSMLTGCLRGKKKTADGVTRFRLDDDANIAASVLFGTSSTPEPRIVNISSLGEQNLCDYILIPGVQMQETTYEGLPGLYVSNGVTYVRLYNTLQVKGISLPSNYAGKAYDLTGILLSRASGDKQVLELALLKSPAKADPNKIEEFVNESQSVPIATFTLDGRNVMTMSKPGLYIVRQGSTVRKILVK